MKHYTYLSAAGAAYVTYWKKNNCNVNLFFRYMASLPCMANEQEGYFKFIGDDYLRVTKL